MASDLGKGREGNTGTREIFRASVISLCLSYHSAPSTFPTFLTSSCLWVTPMSDPEVPVSQLHSGLPLSPMGPPRLPGKLHVLSLGAWALSDLPTRGCAGGTSRRSLNTTSFWAMPLPLLRAHVETHNQDFLCSLADRFVPLWGRK